MKSTELLHNTGKENPSVHGAKKRQFWRSLLENLGSGLAEAGCGARQGAGGHWFGT